MAGQCSREKGALDQEGEVQGDWVPGSNTVEFGRERPKYGTVPFHQSQALIGQ